MHRLNKKELRARLNKRLCSLGEKYLAESGEEIVRTLAGLSKFLEARRVFLYRSVGREVDTAPLIDYCVKNFVPWALPRTLTGGGMDFCLIDGSFGLTPRPPFGIPQPPDFAPSALPRAGDVIIVPALSYDEDLYRLGHGGGHYDRYLDGCPAYAIGLIREEMMIERLPRQWHDIAVDCLVTEKKVRNR